MHDVLCVFIAIYVMKLMSSTQKTNYGIVLK